MLRSLTKPRILVFDNYDSFTYNLVHLIERVADVVVEVHRNDRLSLDEVERFDRIVLSPGPGIPEEAGALLPLIRRYVEQKPILGVCLGHQAIVEALGGTLHNLSTAFHGVATPIYTNTDSGFMFQDIPSSFAVGRYHSWVAQTLPDCLRVTAHDESKTIMAFQHQSLPVAGVQFHPESIMTEYGETLMRNFLHHQ